MALNVQTLEDIILASLNRSSMTRCTMVCYIHYIHEQFVAGKTMKDFLY